MARAVPVIAAGPYNSGLLAKRGGQFNYGPASQQVIDKAERLRAVCERFGVALADAAIRFLQAQPAIVLILPGHHSPAELAANIASLDAPIPIELWAALKAEGLIALDAPVPE
jgi:D-threo-aldose 1-dehydrogenase